MSPPVSSWSRPPLPFPTQGIAAASCLLTSFYPPSSLSVWQPKEPSRTWHKHSLVQRPPSHNPYWMNPRCWLRPSMASSCTPNPIQPRLKPSRLYRLSPSSSPASLGSLDYFLFCLLPLPSLGSTSMFRAEENTRQSGPGTGDQKGRSQSLAGVEGTIRRDFREEAASRRQT